MNASTEARCFRFAVSQETEYYGGLEFDASPDYITATRVIVDPLNLAAIICLPVVINGGWMRQGQTGGSGDPT